MKRICVVHIITQLELGGAQGNTLYTISHLDPEQFEVHLVCGPGGMLDEEARRLPAASITFCPDLVREINPVRDWKGYRQVKNLLEKIKPDIVHTHSSKAGILGRFAARAAGVPVIIHTYHGFGFHRFQSALTFRLYLFAERMACRRTDHLVFVSQDNWNWAQQLGLTRHCSASLIRSGIPVHEIQSIPKDSNIRRRLGIPEKARLVGMIACLKPQKDPVTYVEAAGLVLQEYPDTHFLLVGDGVLKEQVLKKAGSLPDGKFHFLGWRRDVFEILASLDVLVLTSLWEGLPRVLPEAIVAGVPVVASRIDGNKEIIEQSRAGLLAEPGDSNDFAAKIQEAFQSNLTVPKAARDSVTAEFNIDAMIDGQQNLYLQLRSQK